MAEEAPSAAAPPGIIKEGYVVKRSVTSKFGLHTWKKQYFILDDQTSLTYYTGMHGVIKGQILLTHDAQVKMSDKRSSAFQVATPYVTMHLQAPNDVTRDEWITSIKSVIRALTREKTTTRFKEMRKKAAQLKKRQYHHTGRGTHTFKAAGSVFEVDTRYEFIRVIGQGAYGNVIAAKDTKTGKQVAIKKIRSAFANVVDGKRILREIKLGMFLKHRNISYIIDLMRQPPIIRDDGTVLDKFDDVYIVLDLMDADLHKIIYSSQVLSEEHVQYLMFQLLSAMKYLQSANVIHRDLKPSNVLVNAACELRVCDFGLARGMEECAEEELTRYVVTRWYRAPELLLDCDKYTESIDIWSVGCIFAELLGRKPLFAGKDYITQIQLICDIIGSPSESDIHFVNEPSAAKFLRTMPKKEKTPWREVPGLDKASDSALDLLNKLLTFDPSKRISVDDALAHPYLSMYAGVKAVLADEPFDMETLKGVALDDAQLRASTMEQIRIFRGDYYDVDKVKERASSHQAVPGDSADLAPADLSALRKHDVLVTVMEGKKEDDLTPK